MTYAYDLIKDLISHNRALTPVTHQRTARKFDFNGESLGRHHAVSLYEASQGTVQLKVVYTDQITIYRRRS